MNMNELGIDDDQLVFDWSGGVDPLPEYDHGITERELAFMRELDPNFGYGGDADVIDLDARGFKREYELIVMRILFPKPVKKIPSPNYPNNYTYKATAADALWLPEEEKSGIKDKVQALIRRCHDEVGKSFAALRQYVAEHASEFTDIKDEVKGECPPKDLDDSIDAD